jgi:hypothetical protein
VLKCWRYKDVSTYRITALSHNHFGFCYPVLVVYQQCIMGISVFETLVVQNAKSFLHFYPFLSGGYAFPDLLHSVKCLVDPDPISYPHRLRRLVD